MGLRASDRDPSADPAVDFYRFANGGWLDANPIPAGYPAWGAFEEVSQRNDIVLRELLERAAAEPVDELDRLLGDAFAAAKRSKRRAWSRSRRCCGRSRAPAITRRCSRCCRSYTAGGSSRCSAGA
jgi:hypothetical protein